MSNPMLQLIVLAAIAVFLIIRLRGVLGSRDGFERPPVTDATPARRAPTDLATVPDDGDDISDHVEAGSPAARALGQMKAVDPSFEVGAFLSGARQAYEMIVTAFERGDLNDVRPFLSDPVAQAFDGAIADRTGRGLTSDAQYLGTRETTLEAASFDPETSIGEVSVKFVGEMIATHKNAHGEVVEGDTRARKQRNVWTFARRMDDPDPNWQLVETA